MLQFCFHKILQNAGGSCESANGTEQLAFIHGNIRMILTISLLKVLYCN